MLMLSIDVFGSEAQNGLWVYSVTGSSFVALFCIGMESGGSSSLGLKNKEKKTDKTRRAWTPVEEGVLVELMKELVTKGWKTENGFKLGYLLKLEFEMLKKIPGTDLRANPHITSRITIWKKFHGSLQMMLNGNSGVGFNPTTGLLDYHDDCWARIVKVGDDIIGSSKSLRRDVVRSMIIGDITSSDSSSLTTIVECTL
ncbi:hypothetical protein ACS0TY_035032 [Phlomoides rotata]